MVKMIGGVFLLRENGRTIVKDKTSGPFDAGDCEEELIRAGIATRVQHVPADPERDQECEDSQTPAGMFEVPPDIRDQLPDGMTVESIPEYSIDSTANELRAIAEHLGLTFGARMTKAEMVSALDAFMDENVEDGLDLDDLDDPDLDFDASEAVQ